MGTMAVYSIGLLPVEGTDDLTLQIRDYRDRMVETLRILDGIRTGPLELGISTNTELDSARYYVASCIAMIDAHLRQNAVSQRQPVVNVYGLKNSIDLYLQALLRAKGAWNAYIDGDPLGYGMAFGADGAVPEGAEANVTPIVEDTQEQTQKLLNASKPPDIKSLLVLGGLGLGVAGLIWMMRKG